MKIQWSPEQQEERRKVVKAKEKGKKKSPLGNGAHEDKTALAQFSLRGTSL